MKRTALHRRTRLRRVRSQTREPAPSWWRAQPGEACARCGMQAADGHHIVTAQFLRVNGFADRLWDPRNRLPLCRQCHAAHHGTRRITRRFLLMNAPGVFAFAAELGVDWVLDREYPS